MMPKKKRAGGQPRKADPRKNPHNFDILPPQTVAQGLSRKLFAPHRSAWAASPLAQAQGRAKVLSAGRKA